MLNAISFKTLFAVLFYSRAVLHNISYFNILHVSCKFNCSWTARSYINKIYQYLIIEYVHLAVFLKNAAKHVSAVPSKC